MEKIRLANKYRLARDGDYYYLCRENASNSFDEIVPSGRSLSGNTRSPASVTRSDGFGSSTSERRFLFKDVPRTESLAKNEESPLKSCSSTAVSQKASQSPHDIQIHVQRPSPIREIPVTADLARKLENIDESGVKSENDNTEAVKDDKKVVKSEVQETEAGVDDSGDDGITFEAVSNSLPEDASRPTVSSVARPQEKDLHRIRPISGPAILSVSPSSEFDGVRKTRSVTDKLDNVVPDGAYPVLNDLRTTPLKQVGSQSSQLSEAGSKGFRRFFSTVSFDQIEMDKSKESDALVPQSVVQRSIAFNDVRSRHTSGVETPMSYLDSASVASTGTGEGGKYDSEFVVAVFVLFLYISATDHRCLFW